MLKRTGIYVVFLLTLMLAGCTHQQNSKAVTSVEIDRTSVPQNIIMCVDRPFVFVIREHHSNTTFHGQIVEPEIGG